MGFEIVVIGLAIGVGIAAVIALGEQRLQRRLKRDGRPSRIRDLEYLNARLDEYIADLEVDCIPRRPPPAGLVQGAADLPGMRRPPAFPTERPDRIAR